MPFLFRKVNIFFIPRPWSCPSGRTFSFLKIGFRLGKHIINLLNTLGVSELKKGVPLLYCVPGGGLPNSAGMCQPKISALYRTPALLGTGLLRVFQSCQAISPALYRTPALLRTGLLRVFQSCQAMSPALLGTGLLRVLQSCQATSPAL